jgi:hypothetical protein
LLLGLRAPNPHTGWPPRLWPVHKELRVNINGNFESWEAGFYPFNWNNEDYKLVDLMYNRAKLDSNRRTIAG